jgi:GTP-binding protein YchF
MSVVRVPDERVDALSALFTPKKTTHAALTFIDIVGIEKETGRRDRSDAVFDAVRNVDSLALVVRGFQSVSPPDPLNEAIDTSSEIILSDLDRVEKRIERLEKQISKMNRAELSFEIDLLRKCRDCLSDEKFLNSLDVDKNEQTLLRGFQLLSLKPMLVILNLPEDKLGKKVEEIFSGFSSWAGERRMPLIPICGTLEEEISKLNDDEAKLFLEEMGISEPGLNLMIRTAYKLLDRISFFTVGEDEVKAWTVQRGTHARPAAGEIHSDIERGFIKADVTAYHDLIACGSLSKARSAGKSRLEGKDYVVKDGDVIHFRFNV